MRESSTAEKKTQNLRDQRVWARTWEGRGRREGGGTRREGQREGHSVSFAVCCRIARIQLFASPLLFACDALATVRTRRVVANIVTTTTTTIAIMQKCVRNDLHDVVPSTCSVNVKCVRLVLPPHSCSVRHNLHPLSACCNISLHPISLLHGKQRSLSKATRWYRVVERKECSWQCHRT